MNTQIKRFNSNMCRILFATCLSALCLIALSTQAATITVTNTNDSGPGSFRQVLADANNEDTINFDSSLNGQTITLTSGELLVNKSVTISGPGPNNLTVDGNHASRVFHVSGGVTATIAGLSITNGFVIYPGGGILNDHSTLTVINCTLSGNSSASWGGGGIYNLGQAGPPATLKVTNCTLSGNTGYQGAGIYNDGLGGSATLEILNCTLSGNLASAGGGIYNLGQAGSATLKVTNSTLSSNFSAGWEDDIVNDGYGATLEIGSTILDGPSIFYFYGTITSLGYNLSSDNGSGFLTATGDQINTDPMLGPLQYNGGPTFTHALLPGSPAIDAGDPSLDPYAFDPPLLYDQRGAGFPRVLNNRIDIGAFEQATPTPTPTPTATPHDYAAQVQPPINADGSSVFSVRRGVVPVKFTLTLNGVATCDLPPATIAVTRTAGGVMGQVNESLYSGNADAGSNFRIDSCQYVYNLNSSALGVGTYRIDILIDGQVVGTAVFQLE